MSELDHKSSPVPLSKGQREIMEIVWDKGEVSVFEIRQILSEVRDVARNTVRTMVERMEDKGWLTHRVIGRTYFYSALVPREVSLGARVVEMVDKACGGHPERLMTALMDYRGLTSEEVQRIREILDQSQDKKTGKRKAQS
ncbi:BlaI/MecI/CopY family transcriptional regulator [Gimesia aquarii]|uniref:Penicillinase repressor n=1 Tax=Gimesia aquarii TaxID=2527964 RepID=A0A517W2W5_9PLAN|nr:BlaI/MecI/CopY family transcriptional regulator [Gimesia aquarii]QDT99589.1 Penicillinase repressor [Gimesia aquarii]